ncbi:AraC family transcriptional regulator [Paenibacillus endoradicis]|uniref:AraC family transcriptional regulator n=1 Tax=Paenibacillus endoradicis TaxID=2972487 RepID=UPI002159323E|nr:AraC family transcriptional regulator [Paenibacillus endoradicis]MCR8660180.1 AraC family transcriptional regulator [Paenibacillus endoradicis]
MHMKIIFPQLELHSIESNFTNDPHVHPAHYQMTIPLRGHCQFTHKSKERKLIAGEGLLLPPQNQHNFHQGAEDGIIIFQINDDSLYPADASSFPEPKYKYEFNPTEVSGFLHQWSSSFFLFGDSERLALEEKELQALHYVHGLIWGLESSYTKQLRTQHYQDNRYISRVLEYIHAHYSESIRIEQLSAIALQSRYHFIRCFKSNTGLTPYQYVLKLRIEKAQQQLRQTQKSVMSISIELGFSSPSQFYRSFIKNVGITPEQYRSSTTI